MTETYQFLSDNELLARCGEDHDAVRELVLRYTRLVRACARPLFLAGGDHEDLVQEGMIGLLDAIRGYSAEGGAPFECFASICIRRRMISAIRSANARKHAPLNDALPLEQSGGQGSDPETALIGRERFASFMSVLRQRLSPAEQKILALYLEGFSYRQIADRLDRPTKSVDNAVQRIRRKAAAVIGEDGYPV